MVEFEYFQCTTERFWTPHVLIGRMVFSAVIEGGLGFLCFLHSRTIGNMFFYTIDTAWRQVAIPGSVAKVLASVVLDITLFYGVELPLDHGLTITPNFFYFLQGDIF